MNVAYAILPATLASFLYAMMSNRLKKVFYIIVWLFLNFGLLFLGNRRCFTVAIAFVAIIFVLFDKKKLLVRSIILITICMIALVVVLVIPDEQIAHFIPSSRVIDLIRSRELFSDTIRLNLWRNGLYEIFRSPFEVKGVLYDRYFYVTAFNGNNDLGFTVRDELFNGLYAHNIFIEVLLQLGVILGGILIIFLLYIMIKSFFKTKSFDRLFAILFIFIGFMQLLVSFSYLLSASFWAMVGVLITYSRTKQIEKYIYPNINLNEEQSSLDFQINKLEEK